MYMYGEVSMAVIVHYRDKKYKVAIPVSRV